jgi:hypothetical protein
VRRLTTRTLAPSPILEPLITFECLWPTEQFTYAATHGDTSTAKLMAHRGRRDANSAAIWRRSDPWAYRSAARLTSTGPP